MGTTWSLKFCGPVPAPELQGRLQAHLDQREAVLSHWRRDSALSRFNDSRSTDWQPVPEELLRAVETARAIAGETTGALDVTLAPVIDLWGFGGAVPGDRKPPEEGAIQAALRRCGWRHLHSRATPPALRKDEAALRINVASVAEGLVMDELVALLRQAGHERFLLEVGGEVYAAGTAPDGGPWRVGVQTPEAAPGEILQSVPLAGECLATSGNYRHRFESGGRRYSHVLDPRTGRPVTHALASVSVLHPSCALADGYATALMVLGPEEGRAVAERLKLRVVWVEEEER